MRPAVPLRKQLINSSSVIMSRLHCGPSALLLHLKRKQNDITNQVVSELRSFLPACFLPHAATHSAPAAPHKHAISALRDQLEVVGSTCGRTRWLPLHHSRAKENKWVKKTRKAAGLPRKTFNLLGISGYQTPFMSKRNRIVKKIH